MLQIQPFVGTQVLKRLSLCFPRELLPHITISTRGQKVQNQTLDHPCHATGDILGQEPPTHQERSRCEGKSCFVYTIAIPLSMDTDTRQSVHGMSATWSLLSAIAAEHATAALSPSTHRAYVSGFEGRSTS